MSEEVKEVKENDNLPMQSTFNIDQSNLKKSGLDGLLIDHSSFPVMTLNKQFELANHPNFEDKSFDVKVMKTLPKYILIDAKDNQFQEVKYSRDGVYTNDGEPLEKHMTMMVKQGRSPHIKRYLDILVQLVNRYDQLNNHLVVLSISPTSVGLISGFLLQLGLDVRNKIITVQKGIVKTSKSGHNYALWNMSVKQETQQATK